MLKMERDKLVLAAVVEGYTGVLNIFLARGGDVNSVKSSQYGEAFIERIKRFRSLKQS